jgi:hypothetical protein
VVLIAVVAVLALVMIVAAALVNRRGRPPGPR